MEVLKAGGEAVDGRDVTAGESIVMNDFED